jgi:bifunctional DNase/RNase
VAPELVKLMVAEVNVAVPAGPGVEAGLVVLSEVELPRRRLRIIAGKAEVRAIHAAWSGAMPSRPSTWDLYVSTVALLESRVDRVVITAVEEDRHFFARLELDRGGDRRVLTCRPSDGIAIALRAYGAELYAVPEVLDRAGLAADGTRFGPYTWPESGPGAAAAAAIPAAPSGGTAGSPPAGALPGEPTVEELGGDDPGPGGQPSV